MSVFYASLSLWYNNIIVHHVWLFPFPGDNMKKLKSWWMLKLMILIMLQIQARRQTSGAMMIHNGKNGSSNSGNQCVVTVLCTVTSLPIHCNIWTQRFNSHVSKRRRNDYWHDPILSKLTYLLTQIFKSCFPPYRKRKGSYCPCWTFRRKESRSSQDLRWWIWWKAILTLSRCRNCPWASQGHPRNVQKEGWEEIQNHEALC